MLNDILSFPAKYFEYFCRVFSIPPASIHQITVSIACFILIPSIIKLIKYVISPRHKLKNLELLFGRASTLIALIMLIFAVYDQIFLGNKGEFGFTPIISTLIVIVLMLINLYIYYIICLIIIKSIIYVKNKFINK